MPAVRVFTPPNRLARVIGGPNDRSIASLARDADMNVSRLRGGLRRHIVEQHAIITRLVAAPEAEIFAECRAIDAAALTICELAAAAGLPAVGEVARGLHALLRALAHQGVWHTEALQLHAYALAVLNSDTPPSLIETDRFIAHLAAMRQWLGVLD